MHRHVTLWLALLIPCVVMASDGPSSAGRTAIQTAVDRGLSIVQKAASNYPKHRNCFSCHHQTLPILAMVTAQRFDFEIDAELVRTQAEFSHKSFQERAESMKEGKGIGGQAMTVAYGLWTFALAGQVPDDTTEAMVTFLLKTQKDDGRWAFQTSRPPMEASYVTSTVLSAYYLQEFATESQHAAADTAVARAKDWLATASVESNEDRTFRLWGLELLGAERAAIDAARDQLLSAQREDGGWSQLDDMESDAYATGQALFVLREVGVPREDHAFERGVAFLIRTQCADGSWFVKTRSKPVQVYFDNGDPHGEHQFISIPATSWAVAALAR